MQVGIRRKKDTDEQENLQFRDVCLLFCRNVRIDESVTWASAQRIAHAAFRVLVLRRLVPDGVHTVVSKSARALMSDIELLCELLRSTAIVVNREAVRKQLLVALTVEKYPPCLLEVLIQGFEWRDVAKNLQRLVENQSEKVYILAQDAGRLVWEFREEKRLEKEAWKVRWDTSYWVPGNSVYNCFHTKK